MGISRVHSAGGGDLNWFYVREGRRVGPFDRAPLIAQLLTLDAPEAVLVWRTGLAAWTKAGLLDELRGELPPPVPGSLPGQASPLELPASVVSETPAEAVLPSLPSGDPVSDGDVAESPGQGHPPGQAGSTGQGEGDDAERRRRRHRHRVARPSKVPSYLLPLVLLFVAVMLGLWFLLRRMNEVPPGQILQKGALRPTGSPTASEPIGSLPGASQG